MCQARPYTPTSLDSDPRVRGFMDLVVKIYRPQGGRPGGVMTCHLDDLAMGSVLQVRYGRAATECSLLAGRSPSTRLMHVHASRTKLPALPNAALLLLLLA